MKRNHFLEWRSILMGLIAPLVFFSYSSHLHAQVLIEDFSGGSLPTGWSITSASNDSWEFGGSVDFGPATVIIDATGNSGEYAHIDFSDDPDTTALLTPRVSIAGLTNPELSFYYITQTTSTSFSPYNRLIVDYWNGASWTNITVIDSLTTLGWTQYQFNISSYTFNTDSVQFRFAAQEGGAAVGGTGTATYDQDLALDEIRIGDPITCPAVSSLTANNFTSSGAILNWIAGGTETLWEIEYGPSPLSVGTGTTVITSSNSNYTLSGLSSYTEYDVVIRAICGPGDTSVYSLAQTFMTSGGCNSSGSYTYVNNSTLSSSIQSFTASTPGNWITLDFTAGSTESGYDYWFINDAADGSGNTIATGDGSIVGSYTSTTGEISFYVTSDVVVTGSTFNFTSTCSTPPSCLPVSSLNATATSSTTATLDWTAGANEINWQVEVTGQGMGMGTGVTNITSSNPYSVTGLSSNTVYEYYVRAICGPGDTSSWVGPYSFTTPCNAVIAPYYQNFDGLALTSPYTDLPSCWEPQVGPDYWDVTNDITNNSHSYLPNIGDHTTGSSNYMWIDASSDITANAMITGDIDISQLSNAMAGFWFASNNTTNNINHTISLDVWDGSAWVNVTTESGNFSGWTDVFGYLPTGIPSVTKFRIQAIANPNGNSSTYFYNDLGVDDFYVISGPSCIPVSNLTASGLTNTSVDLGWTPGGSETLWEYEYVLSGTGFGSGVTDTTSQNPITVSGLTGGYSYDFRVRAVCAAGDSSYWEGPFTATIPCSPFAGTYTLGSNGDFTSFSDLSTRLNSCGINGDVIINVSPGVYNEKFALGVISGASQNATITINGGDTSLVTLTYNDYATIALQGTDYLTIKNMTIENTATSSAYGVFLTDTASFNTIDSCHIVNDVTSSSSSIAGILATGSETSTSTEGMNAEFNTFSNSVITGGYYGIRLEGASATRNEGNTVANNVFDNQYLYGIYMDDQDSITITGNTISNLRATTADGIYLFDLMMFNISNNIVNAPDYAFYLSDGNFDATPTSRGVISNNIFYSGSDYALYLDDVEEVNIWHNTTYSDGDYGFRSNDLLSADIKNNMFVSNGSYSYYGVDSFDGDSANSDLDYNLYYRVDAGDLIYDGGGVADLATWLTNLPSENINSVNSDPVFSNVSNQDFTPLSGAIDNIGTPLGVTTDVYGNPRSTSTPDIGAIEFTGLASDLAMTGVSLSQVDLCYGTSDTAFATLQNVIGTTVDFSVNNQTVYWQVNGPVNTIDSLVITSGTLDPGADTTVFITSIDMSQPGDYYFGSALAPSAVNASVLNDTAYGASAETVQNILSVAYDTINVTNNYSTADLIASSPLLPTTQVFFTEISQYLTPTGAPTNGWPSYFSSSNDYVELTGVPGTDISGYQIEIYNTTGLSGSILEVPAGAVIGTNGTVILGFEGTSTDAANNYYRVIGTNVGSSTTTRGYVLKDANGTMLDAVGYGGSSTSYTFPVSSGVTSSDWSGSMSGTISSSSGMRLEGADNNSASNWVRSADSPQDPNTLNSGVTVPSAPVVTGFDWYLSSSSVSTSPAYSAGPYSNDSTYTYVATYTNTCGTFSDSTVVTVSLLDFTLSSTDVTCNGLNVGTASVSASGSVSPYSYSWSNGETTAMVDSLLAGTYYVTVYDANNDSLVDSVTITEPLVLAGTVALDSNVTCNGGNGGATLNVTGGTTPYTYLWSDASTNASLTAVAGSYVVTVTDANGCTDTGSVTITEPTLLVANASLDSNATSCQAGGASVVASGGVAPYTFSWSNGFTVTSMVDGQGDYAVSVTDANGCVSTDSITIGGPTSSFVAFSSVTSDVSCNGAADGVATATASGGNSPYTYTWSNGATTASTSGLAAGTYSVTISDGGGCIVNNSVTVTEPAVLVSSVTLDSNATCNGLSDGGLSASTTGGTTPYSYTWSTGDTSMSNVGLAAGTYTVTVVDANGCSATSSNTVTEPAILVASVGSTTDNLCFGASSGDATAQATGGTTPFMYMWSNGDATAMASGLAAGTYTATVTDANGCTSTTSATISEPTELVSSLSNIVNVTCNGLTDGSADASATGGVSPYTYAWSNSSTSATVSSLGAGTYTVTITDNNSCTVLDTLVINEPTVLGISISSYQDVACFGDTTGSASAAATGGTTPYNYTWSTGSANSIVTGLVAGTFSVTVTDDNGCTANTNVLIAEPTALVTTTTATDALCFGSMDGTVTATVSGGTTAYAYAWSNGATTSSVTGVTAGTYTYTVTDANGCTEVDTATVAEPTQLMASIDSTNITCFDGMDGTASVSASGGTTPYTYMWSNGNATDSINGVAAGSYSVILTDSNGCTLTDTVVLTQPDSISLDVQFTDVTCENGEDGSAVATATGSNGSFTYEWNNGDTSASLSGITEGTYSVTATDMLGCMKTTDVVLTFLNPLPVVNLGADTAVGMPTIITLYSGANGSHLWNDGSTNDSLVAELWSDSTIWVEVTSDAGCINSDTITITGLVGIDEAAEAYSIKLYPNPTDGQLNIEIDDYRADEVAIQIIDFTGKVILNRKWDNPSTQFNEKFDLGQYSQGMYFVNITLDGKLHSERVVVY